MQDRIWEIVAKKLAGEASVHELEELEEILRANPELHYPLQTISDLWFHPSSIKEDTQEAFNRHLERMKAHGIEMDLVENEELITLKETRSGFAWLKWMSAACLLLLAGWYFFLKDSSGSGSNQGHSLALNSEVSTKNGSRSKVMLPDGTQVWLNAGSKLTYGKDFGASLREVSLTGEAYFDVVKDSSRPFLIHARNVDIKVLGTAFNVKSYPGDKTTETSLIRGSVEVQIKNRPKEKIILKPNEKLVVAVDSDSLVAQPSQPRMGNTMRLAPQVVLDQVNYHEKEHVIVETSWVENILIFDEETFAELAPKLERWYGIKIKFTSPEIQNIRLTGSFKGESLQTALKGLKITANFNYDIKNDTVIISP